MFPERPFRPDSLHFVWTIWLLLQSIAHVAERPTRTEYQRTYLTFGSTVIGLIAIEILVVLIKFLRFKNIICSLISGQLLFPPLVVLLCHFSPFVNFLILLHLVATVLDPTLHGGGYLMAGLVGSTYIGYPQPPT